MPDLGYVYECDRCHDRITAPRRIFDRSLCPRPAPDGGRCLGHLELVESEADEDTPPS